MAQSSTQKTSSGFEGFKSFMDALRVCYPSARPPDDEWLKRCKLYHAKLETFPVQVLARAFNLAIKAHPDFFPSLGQIQKLSLDQYRRYQEEKAEMTRKLLDQQETKLIEGEREQIPWELEKAKRYIEAAPNKFERLGRMWEMEAKQLNLKPGSDEAQEFNLRNVRAFTKMIAEHKPFHEGKRWTREGGWQ